MSSDDDRLMFGEGPLGGPLEPEEEPTPQPRARPNRAFIFIAIAMGGLILLGILALIAAWQIWLPARREQQLARITNTAVAGTMEAAAWTPTFTPSPTALLPTATVTLPPTETPVPTATSTKVVSSGTDAPLATLEPTQAALATVAAATKIASGASSGAPTTPAAGLGGLGTAAIAVGLAGLVLAVRKIRTSR
jgi:hypothetical protein